MHPRIIYTSYGGTIEIEIRPRYGVQRAQGDIAISRTAAIGLPLDLCCLIRADGTVDEWYAEWKHSEENTYWHFSHGSEKWALGHERMGEIFPGHAPSQGQTETIAKMLYGNVRPFGMKGSCGAPVQRWAFSGLTIEQIEAIGNDGNRAFYA